MHAVIPLLPHVINAGLKQHFDKYLVFAAKSVTGNKLQSEVPVGISPSTT